MRALLLGLLVSSSCFGLEIIRPVIDRRIQLRIVRAEPDSFGTYLLLNQNGREMLLVCARNRVYDDNPKAFIEYRNYYNEIAGNFTLADNEACLEMGKFLEQTSAGISEQNPFVIDLSTSNMMVDRITYPKLDPFADRGTHLDLLPRVPVYVPDAKEAKLPAVRELP